MTMFRGILFRFLSRLSMLAIVGTLVFSVQVFIPGDPAELLLSSAGSNPTRDNIERLREKMGLNLPILEQYWKFITSVARLDFGTSLIDDSSIGQTIAMRLPRTLELVFVAMLLAIVIAVPLGTGSALRAGKRLDAISSGFSALLAAIPVFVVGTLLILLFSQTLGMLPAGGYIDFSVSPVGHGLNLLLPAVTVALSLIPIVYRMTRASVLESLSNEWVRTAVAKGLPRARVISHHVLRNSLGPVVTVVGLQLGVLIGSTVLIEFVFNWPGLSGFLITAVEQRDYPSVRAVVLIVAALFILINFLVELLQGMLDPRV